jgi:hypothetical protein
MMLMPYLAAIDVSLCGSAGRGVATAWATSPTGVIRCQFIFLGVIRCRVIRCRFIFSGKNDELTPDFPTLVVGPTDSPPR